MLTGPDAIRFTYCYCNERRLGGWRDAIRLPFNSSGVASRSDRGQPDGKRTDCHSFVRSATDTSKLNVAHTALGICRLLAPGLEARPANVPRIVVVLYTSYGQTGFVILTNFLIFSDRPPML